MAIVVFFDHIHNCPTEKYYETLRRLEQAGAGAPAGQLSHVMYVTDGRPHVVNIYDSPESFEAFGHVLMLWGPIIPSVVPIDDRVRTREAYNDSL